MTDPASFALAVAGLPAIFVSCVDCFEYIRLGRRFGKDFGFCLAKLEAAQVRLTRWGEPIGLLENKIDVKGAYKEADIIKAYEWLGQIEATFEEARETSAKYAEKQQKKGRHGDLEILDGDKIPGANNSTKSLVMSMKTMARNRQKHLSLPRKITWALYGKDSFDSLIEDLVSLINDLVELFPSTKPRLQELCNEEIGKLDKESVLDLVEVLKNDDKNLDNTDDKILSKTIDDYIEAHRHEFHDIKIDGSGTNRFGDEHGFQAGVKPGSIKVDGMDIKGSGYTHAGHVFYGPQGAQGMHSYAKDRQRTLLQSDKVDVETVPERTE
ncbi:prion-inhibition and propagation-domain-containing protein [Pyrenochaeta sp. MPI-SDFR-AT-0127]|nr:prion-inhibition and propagation-domain-containing protein [Pyrenochaeta sp. MPI-SDFR-AT-0127]